MNAPRHYPRAVIVELKPLIENYRHHSLIYNTIPLHAILEAMLRIPVYSNCNDALWDVVEHYMTESEDKDPSGLDSAMMDYVSITLEMLMEHFYRDLERILGRDTYEKYVFHRWLGTDSVILINTD